MPSFHIPDMRCGHCADTLAQAIAAVDPVAHLAFDIPAKRLHVRDHSATVQALMAAMREAGYAPLGMPPAAPARAGGCGCGCGTAQRIDLPQSRVPAQDGCCI